MLCLRMCLEQDTAGHRTVYMHLAQQVSKHRVCGLLLRTEGCVGGSSCIEWVVQLWFDSAKSLSKHAAALSPVKRAVAQVVLPVCTP